MSKEYTDRFTEAERELEEKSAFVCRCCSKTYSQQAAEEHERQCCGRPLSELVKESFGA